jgi:hypothetical protein
MSPPEVIPLNAPAAAGAAETATDVQASSRPLWDLEFQRAHRRLQLLSRHVLTVTTSFDERVQQAARLGDLNVLEFATLPTKGRRATVAEWNEVEARTHTIWAALSEPQRRKFLTTQIPGWFSYLLLALLAAAVSSVFFGYLIQPAEAVQPRMQGGLLLPFMGFVVALGAMGACASIGMNALSFQDDATFDMSNGKFLWLRLLLGALFGAILTLAWAFPVYREFIWTLSKSESGASAFRQDQLYQSMMLLTPFVLGFSTSLVILVLSRAVEAVQTFFGKSGTGAAPHAGSGGH